MFEICGLKIEAEMMAHTASESKKLVQKEYKSWRHKSGIENILRAMHEISN